MTLTPQETAAMVWYGDTMDDGTISHKHGSVLASLVRRLLEREKLLTSPETVERLAAIEHERWAGWMRHLFSKCGSVWHRDGGTTGEQAIPLWAVVNWTRQMNTPYADLTEEEKESDRAEVRKTLAALSALNPGEKK